jgi:PPOX class probable F420-dependent enzyme
MNGKPGARGVNRRREIRMTPDEVDAFLRERRSMIVCTMNGDSTIHAVAMWYGFVDGKVAFETKHRSQKVRNLGRNPTITCLVEDGSSYDELRGVQLVGTGEVIDDPAQVWSACASVFDRYVAPYDDSQKRSVDAMANNRIAVKVHVDRIVTWDHRKLSQ